MVLLERLSCAHSICIAAIPPSLPNPRKKNCYLKHQPHFYYKDWKRRVMAEDGRGREMETSSNGDVPVMAVDWNRRIIVVVGLHCPSALTGV